MNIIKNKNNTEISFQSQHSNSDDTHEDNTNETNPKTWGPSLWKFLHSMSVNYPENPSNQIQASARQYFYSLRHLLPCSVCQKHYNQYISRRQPQVRSSTELQEWVLWLHNEISHDVSGKPAWTMQQMKDTYPVGSESMTLTPHTHMVVEDAHSFHHNHIHDQKQNIPVLNEVTHINTSQLSYQPPSQSPSPSPSPSPSQNQSALVPSQSSSSSSKLLAIKNMKNLQLTNNTTINTKQFLPLLPPVNSDLPLKSKDIQQSQKKPTINTLTRPISIFTKKNQRLQQRRQLQQQLQQQKQINDETNLPGVFQNTRNQKMLKFLDFPQFQPLKQTTTPVLISLEKNKTTPGNNGSIKTGLIGSSTQKTKASKSQSQKSSTKQCNAKNKSCQDGTKKQGAQSGVPKKKSCGCRG